MRSMFQSAASFSKDLSSWAVSKVRDMRNMFKGASSFNQALCWDLAHHQDDDFTYEFSEVNLYAGYTNYYSYDVEDNAEGMFDSAGPSASLNQSCLPCVAGEYRTGPDSCGVCPAGSFGPELIAGSSGATACTPCAARGLSEANHGLDGGRL